MAIKGFIQQIKESLRSLFHKKTGQPAADNNNSSKPVAVQPLHPRSLEYFRLTGTRWPLQDEWRKTPAGIYYYSLENYVPDRYNCHQYPFLKAHYKQIRLTRKWIWDFKYNLKNPSPVAHARAVEQAVKRVSFIINNTFPGCTDCITFLCLPASNDLIYNLRFREFAALVCMQTGMIDAFSHTHIQGDIKPKHLGGKDPVGFIVDRGWLQGRNVILFDDVTSSGKTIDAFGTAMSLWNIRIMCALTLARTVSPEEMEQGIYVKPELEDKFEELDREVEVFEVELRQKAKKKEKAKEEEKERTMNYDRL